MEAPVTVSDHALIRHLQRVLNLDLDQVRRDIIDQVEHGTKSWGNHVTGVNGITYIMNGANNVVTLYDESKPATPYVTKPKAGRHNHHKQNNGKTEHGRHSTRTERVTRMAKMLEERGREGA